MSDLTIGKLAKMVGIPTKTIRFYEETGIISPAQRSSNGYRVYDEVNIEQLSLIKNARDLGLPISEIRKLMIGCDEGSCEKAMQSVREEIQSYIKLLDRRIAQFSLL